MGYLFVGLAAQYASLRTAMGSLWGYHFSSQFHGAHTILDSDPRA